MIEIELSCTAHKKQVKKSSENDAIAKMD